MKKKASKDRDSARDLQALRREVRQLQRELARAAKAIDALRTAQRGARSAITASRLDVVNAKGVVVASIDSNGALVCSNVSVGSTPAGSRVILGADGLVAATRVEVRRAPGQPAVVTLKPGVAGGRVTLTNSKTKQRLDLAAETAALIAYEGAQGHGVVVITVNGPSGGTVKVTGPSDGNYPSAGMGIVPGGGAGYVLVTRADGSTGGKLGP